MEGTIRHWRPDVVREILRRAGYSSEPLSAGSCTPPPAVELPATAATPPLHASSLLSSTADQEEIPDILMPPVAPPSPSAAPVALPHAGPSTVLSTRDVLLFGSSVVPSLAAVLPPAVVLPSSPESPRPHPTSHEAVGNLEINLVELRPIRSDSTISASRLSEGQQVAHCLFHTFTSGYKMVLAMQLLDMASSRTQAPELLGRIRSFGEIEGAAPTAGMLAASRLAKRFLDNMNFHPPSLRLKTLMSYITLHLTFEYAIVPRLKRQGPRRGPREIGHMGYRYFYKLLMGYPDSDTRDPPARFATDISFGRALWSLVQELGVAALPMLAVGGTGLMAIARALGPESIERKWLTSALSCARAWWSFAHAIGPATLRTFFGPRDIHYTVCHLVQQLRNEPLPSATTHQINYMCPMSETKLGIDTEVPSKEISQVAWAFETGEGSIPLNWHPNVGQARELKQGNVWEWLASDENLRPIFEFLQQSGSEPKRNVVDFFCDLYNQRAIPDRKAVPFHQLSELYRTRPNPLTRQQFQDILANETGTRCNVFVFVAPLDNVFCGMVLYTQTNRAKIYNWAEGADQGMAVEVGEVTRFLVLYSSSTPLIANAFTEFPTFVARGRMGD